MLPLLDMAESRFSCDVMQLFCRPISQEETRRQKRPIAPARVARERDNDFFWPETISMDGFICGKWTSRPGYPCKGWLLQFAGKTKARLTNLIENERASPCPPPPPPPPHLLGSIKTQFGLLVKCTIIRDPETILGSLFRSERPSLQFAIKTTKQRLKTCSYASLISERAR